MVAIKKIISKMSAIQLVMLSFLMVVIIGSVLLKLPVSSATGKSVPYVDALFTATTATCVTGLVTVPTVSTWSVFGQSVILVLIQIGGLGVITVIAGFMMLFQRKFDLGDRTVISESLNMNAIGGIVDFVKKVLLLTFIIEAIGALLYMTVFVPEFGAKGIWISVFTSISAFCNAGIDIIGNNSLCDYVLNPVVNVTTMLLIISGGLGFVVWFEIGKMLQKKKSKGVKFLSLHSKIALSVTAVLILLGTVLILLFEYNNPDTIGKYTFSQKIMASLFQSVTIRTAGFASIDQGGFTDVSALVSMLFMFIGGSPVGTAGGIKTVTFFVLLISAVSVIRNKRTIDVFNRQIAVDALKRSIAVFTISFLTVVVSTVLLAALGEGSFIDIMYETVSATATVGLSRNLTAGLSMAGKFVIILTMYLGRVGPVSLAFAFSINRSRENLVENPVEKINIG